MSPQTFSPKLHLLVYISTEVDEIGNEKVLNRSIVSLSRARTRKEKVNCNVRVVLFLVENECQHTIQVLVSVSFELCMKVYDLGPQ